MRPGTLARMLVHAGVAGDDPSRASANARVATRLRRRHATDSAHVSLAQRLGTAVWTLDGPLARNAADVGLPVELVT